MDSKIKTIKEMRTHVTKDNENINKLKFKQKSKKQDFMYD